MELVRVRKDDLIKQIEKNRAEHREIFEDALDGYRKQAVAELDTMLREAREGKRIRRQVNLVEPQDHTRDYDRILTMLRMSQDDTIEISEFDFARYVLNQWEWRDQFIASTAGYNSDKFKNRF